MTEIRRPWARPEVLQVFRPAWLLVMAVGMASGCDKPVEHVVPAAAAEPADAAQLLRQMSWALADAHQLTFKAIRQLDASLVEGRNIPESTEIEVSISRPAMILASTSSPAGNRRFYADGHNISLLDERMKLYATVPVAGTLDDVIDALDDRYGFTPPLAEFVSNDPYKQFSAQVQDSVYRGRETVQAVECDHVSLVGKIADAELWISRVDHLPRKFVATFKDRDGSPQLKIDFAEWNLAAKLEGSLFTFDPPKDAVRIAMASIEDVQRAVEKGRP